MILPSENVSFPLVRDVRDELLLAKQSATQEAEKIRLPHYFLFTAGHIHDCITGYCCLRESNFLSSSRLLIRPVIEAVFRLKALTEQPDLYYRIAFSECAEERRHIRGLSDDAEEVKAALADHELQWQKFRAWYLGTFPARPMEDRVLSIKEAATIAKYEGFYKSHYKIYCNCTHGALRATAGGLYELAGEDNLTMAASGIQTVRLLMPFGAVAQNFDRLSHRLDELSGITPWGPDAKLRAEKGSC